MFVWPGLGHKAPAIFLRDRLLRLGLPFAIAALTVIPIAYYAIELRNHPEVSFAAFWWKTVTVGPWPSGPIWFVWLLLTFDLTASQLYRFSSRLVDPINNLSRRGFEKPAVFFLFLLAVSAIVYIPSVLYLTVNRWFEFGPFSVQARASCSMPPTSSLAPASAPRTSIAAFSAPMGGSRRAVGAGFSRRSFPMP